MIKENLKVKNLSFIISIHNDTCKSKILELTKFKLKKIITLFKLITTELLKDTMKDRFDKVNNSLPTFSIDPNSGCANARFKYQRETRKLFICFVCDCDRHETSTLPKVTFSLRAWGQSELYMTKIRDEFVCLGYTTYYKAFDCNDEDWEIKYL